MKRIFLNTQGEKPEEVSQTLVEFLGYINDSSDSYVEKVNEPVVKELQERVKSLKIPVPPAVDADVLRRSRRLQSTFPQVSTTDRFSVFPVRATWAQTAVREATLT